MNHYNNLWVEKYRPKTLSDIILQEDIRDHFKKIDSDVPNILFYGSPGTGKSTMAKIIVSDMLKCQYLYINASDENGIDTIRNKVIRFAQTRSIDEKKKIVILEEADGLTGESLRILRNVMEEYVDTTRFVLTANYINKIIEPIRSRCVMFRLQPTFKECVDRCLTILKTEGIKFDESFKKERFISFLNDRFPDFRRILNDLQKFSVSGTLKIPENNDVDDFISIIVDNIINKTKSSLQIRKFVIENDKSFNNDYQDLLSKMFNHIFSSNNIEEVIKKKLLVDIGEYMYRDNFVLDHEINFFCCILALESTIS